MARCLGNESYGRSIFYGAMIAEGLLALIWVTLGLSFYESPQALYEVIKEGAPNLAVERISKGLLGPVGGILAILGVVVLPITSGDTAFRSARLMLADAFRFPQPGRYRSAYRRLRLSDPPHGGCLSGRHHP